MARLTKAEMLTLKKFGNDPNYRITTDARNKITAIQIDDKIEAQPIQAYLIKVVGKQHSYSKLVSAIDNDKPKELNSPIAKISYGVHSGKPVCNVVLDKTIKCLLVLCLFFCSCQKGLYQAETKPTKKVIIGKIDSLYTIKHKQWLLKFKAIGGNKIHYWFASKPAGAIDTVYVSKLILKP